MGSLTGHISAFFFLFPVGLRRLSSAFSLHLRSSSTPPSPPFRARPWYFSDHPSPSSRLLRNADLYALLLLLPIAAFSDLFIFLTLPSSPHHLPFALRSAALALFWLLLLLPVALQPPILPDALVFLLAALAFLSDHLLLTSPSSPAGAVDGRARHLSSLLTLACSAACMALAVKPAALAAEAALSMGVVMKGTWALQVGVTLFAAPPRGCQRREGWGPMECELDEDSERGVAIVDLLFAVHAVGIVAGVLGVYWGLAQAAAGRPADLDAMITRPMMMSNADFEMD